MEMRELLQEGVMLGFTEDRGKGFAGEMRAGASGHGKGEPWMLKVSRSLSLQWPSTCARWPLLQGGPLYRPLATVTSWRCTRLRLRRCPRCAEWNGLCDPHRRQPTRLPRPWDSPGKNTGVGCHCPPKAGLRGSEHSSGIGSSKD